MQRALFVSDVHLNEPNDERWVRFEKFLQYVNAQADVTDLFLVGDIFDLWLVDHRYFIEKFDVFIQLLKQIKQKGVNVHYFEGNHDLYLNHYWADQLGFSVYPEGALFQQDKTNFRGRARGSSDPQ
ncbi:MAG: metallophosphoesterase [Bdellovibrionales bacterium]